MKTETFNFVFEGKKLRGFINMPVNRATSVIVIIIPGLGKTDFGKPFWYFDALLYSVSDLGLACFRWDRVGCGKSDGDIIMTKRFKAVHKK